MRLRCRLRMEVLRAISGGFYYESRETWKVKGNEASQGEKGLSGWSFTIRCWKREGCGERCRQKIYLVSIGVACSVKDSSRLIFHRIYLYVKQLNFIMKAWNFKREKEYSVRWGMHYYAFSFSSHIKSENTGHGDCHVSLIHYTPVPPPFTTTKQGFEHANYGL